MQISLRGGGRSRGGLPTGEAVKGCVTGQSRPSSGTIQRYALMFRKPIIHRLVKSASDGILPLSHERDRQFPEALVELRVTAVCSRLGALHTAGTGDCSS